MSDNRMNFTIENNSQFPFVEIVLDKGEKAYIQRGSMVYHSSSVNLRTKLNAKGSGLGKLVKAVGRSMVSGESTFITEALSDADGGLLALAPNVPGQVMPLYLGEHQYRWSFPCFGWFSILHDGTPVYWPCLVWWSRGVLCHDNSRRRNTLSQCLWSYQEN